MVFDIYCRLLYDLIGNKGMEVRLMGKVMAAVNVIAVFTFHSARLINK